MMNKVNIEAAIKAIKPKTRIYKLKTRHTPPYREIRVRHLYRSPLMIIDEATGEQAELRFASNQPSPVRTSQGEYARVEQIAFIDGELIVHDHEINKARFLAVHPDNVSNGGKIFYEYDPAAEATAEAEAYETKAELFVKIKELSAADVEGIAFDEIGSEAFELSTKELKRDLYTMAERNPAKLQSKLNNNFIPLKALGAKAERFDVIKIADEGRSIKWASNNRKLCVIPMDKTPYEALADYLMTDEGIEVKKKIVEKLKEFE